MLSYYILESKNIYLPCIGTWIMSWRSIFEWCFLSKNNSDASIFIHFSFPPALQIVPVTKKHSSNNSCKNYSLYYNRVVKIMFSIFSLERISTVNHSLISTGYSLWDYFCNLSKMWELVFTIYQCIYWFCKSNCFFYNLMYKTCKYNNNQL